MARSSSALRRPPAAPSVPAGGFARRGPPGSAQVPPAAVDLGQPPDAEVAVDADRRRGRGAQSNASGRYEPLARVVFDDGWRRLEDLPPFKTTVAIDSARRIITRNDSPDISFDLSINPYRGCEHGCVYCLSGETPILLGDGSQKPLADLRIGDEIYGTARLGHYRRYQRTRVLAHWRTRKPAWRVRLGDGTELLA